MRFFITGSCGFIGSHLCERLLKLNHNIIGIDNFNSIIYDKKYKQINLEILNKYKNYIHITGDLLNDDYINKYNPDIVIHLAAYANVRKSNEIPTEFIKNNVEMTCHLLEQIKNNKNKPTFLYASSSSVYGKNTKIPFKESDNLNNISSIYALSKKTCEEMIELYCKNYGLKSIGYRFFTVYGPRGRPDMAIHKFLYNIHNNIPIKMYGDGSMKRDFTYIDDIINGIINSLEIKLNKSEHRIYNLGNNTPVELKELIRLCSEVVNKKPIILNDDIPQGDVPITFADIEKSKKELNYNPSISLKEGLKINYGYIYV